MVNGGILHPRDAPEACPTARRPPGERVLSPSRPRSTCASCLRLVVEQGTGKFADAPGYLVGGKTGTAEKVAGKRYATHALLSSFVGVFPINDPRYLVLISVDEPHGNAKSHGYATGGWVAAPAVAQVDRAHGPARRNSTGRRRFA